MKILDETDIAIADYVARFGQWTGAEAPKRNETPSGLVREAMQFAETVKGLRLAMLNDAAELSELEDAALADELKKFKGAAK